MTDFEKIVHMTPAFDKRDPRPSKNYGVHGVDLRMILKGPKGATQFVLYTNWMLPHVTREFVAKPIKDAVDIKCRFLPMPADVGYHSPHPIYERQDSLQDECEYLDGRKCYYDGSSLQAEDVYEILLREGSDGVWAELERRYHDLFDEVEDDS